MSDNEKKSVEQRGMGVGYVTLIMLFAVICLTVLAALSYQAARANDKLNEKNAAFTSGFYEADYRAKEMLSQLDEAALLCHNSGFFEDSFEMYCSENENLAVRKTPDGVEVAFTEAVSGNLALSVKITFFLNPQENNRYRIEGWKTITMSDDSDEFLGVWTGEELT